MMGRGPAFALLLGLGLSPALAGEGRQPLPAYTPPPAKEGYSYPDCYCTDSEGARVEMGETACLKIGARRVLARCDMSLNNPTWRIDEEGEGCPGV